MIGVSSFSFLEHSLVKMVVNKMKRAAEEIEEDNKGLNPGA